MRNKNLIYLETLIILAYIMKPFYSLEIQLILILNMEGVELNYIKKFKNIIFFPIFDI